MFYLLYLTQLNKKSYNFVTLEQIQDFEGKSISIKRNAITPTLSTIIKYNPNNIITIFCIHT